MLSSPHSVCPPPRPRGLAVQHGPHLGRRHECRNPSFAPPLYPLRSYVDLRRPNSRYQHPPGGDNTLTCRFRVGTGPLLVTVPCAPYSDSASWQTTTTTTVASRRRGCKQSKHEIAELQNAWMDAFEAALKKALIGKEPHEKSSVWGRNRLKAPPALTIWPATVVHTSS